ncbi:MAG: hypothetical protein KJO40_04830 [Deltaproteobacteria bacterium]|nr:hypothetical protein [Deltaproteobacteria bacterium]NNK06304.1 hypothetical protein [Myxococcales bacterium]MBT8464684.1 hypothetical protein [Deltaproteobacteria bacterium]MBT8482435.1 hypothetical protein [Deltaproteobacteria bacterium]NNK42293.1 hypothetical protein [Myxococcales bacterium]
MKKSTRNVLIGVASILGVLVVGLALVPVLFRDQIVERLRNELNERVEATVTFSDFDVSLLSTFPTLTAEVSELAITGKDEFAEVTLLNAMSVGAGIDLVGLVLRREITIESIEVKTPEVHLIVGPDGKANYDIFPEQSDGSETGSEALAFEIKRLRINDGSLTYVSPSVRVNVAGLEHDGRAKISGAVQELSLKTAVKELSARLGGVQYVKKAKASVDVNATVDTDKERLTLHAVDAAIQQLALEGAGEIDWAGDGTALDLTLASKTGLPIKALISAIPNAYAADFKGLTASGTFSLTAAIQGELGPDDEDIPSFSATAKVQNGAFKYPDLPLGVTDLLLDGSVKHPGGNLDKMRIDVSKYAFAAGKSQAKGRVTVTRPISQPRIDLALDGRFDLEELSKAYPIPDVQKVEGLIVAAVELVAKGERIEKLSGDVEVAGLDYSPASGPEVRIRSARIVLSPQSTTIEELEAQVGESDLSVSGIVSPLTTLLLDDQKVTASVWLKSKRLRVEDFASSETSDADSGEAFLLPDNIDAKLQFDVGTLTYEDLVLRNFKGAGRLRDRKLVLEGVRADALGGSMKVDGTVSTPIDSPASFDLRYAVNDARFVEAFESLPSMRAFVPVSKFLDGRFSTDLDASGTLSEDLSPQLSSIAASGIAAAVQSKLNSEFKPLAALNEAVPTIPKPLDIESFRTRFKIDDGRVRVNPFTVKARGVSMVVGGTHGLDQEMSYQVSTDVPINKLSSKLSKQIQVLGLDLSKADMVGVRANLTGSLTSPRVSVDVDTKGLRGAVADAVSAELAEQKARALREVTEQANRLIEEAEKRAAQIRAEAAKAAELARKEGYARADQLEKKSAQNPIAAIAAKESAKRLRIETDKRAKQLVSEADKRASQAVDEARKRKAQMLLEAEKRSDQTTQAIEGQTDKLR